MNTILIVVFLVIFIATAAITLCALPGWIKIPDNYLKILFSSLLLEVIACIILLFRMLVFGDDVPHKCENSLSNKDPNWVILNSEGQISQLCINDTVYMGMTVEEFSKKARSLAVYNLVKEESKDGSKSEYLIKNDSAICLGKINLNSMKALNLFDEINLKENTFQRLTFDKASGQWALKQGEENLPEDWSLKITVDNSGYCISDSGINYYNNCTKNANSFNKNNRKLHSFKGSDNAFYFVRISDADNSSTDKIHFVTFIIIRIEIESNLNK